MTKAGALLVGAQRPHHGERHLDSTRPASSPNVEASRPPPEPRHPSHNLPPSLTISFFGAGLHTPTHNGQPNPRRCHGQVSPCHPAPKAPATPLEPKANRTVSQRHRLLETGYAPQHARDPLGSPNKLAGFAGNDSPSFVFPTAIATKGPAGGSGGTGSGRPAVANKPSFLTGGAGPGSNLSNKRGTEDLDFFIGDEAVSASGGPGMLLQLWTLIARIGSLSCRLRTKLPDSPRPGRELGIARNAPIWPVLWC